MLYGGAIFLLPPTIARDCSRPSLGSTVGAPAALTACDSFCKSGLDDEHYRQCDVRQQPLSKRQRSDVCNSFMPVAWI